MLLQNVCRVCGENVTRLLELTGARSKSKISLYTCKSCRSFFTYPQEYDYHQTDLNVIDYYLSHQEYIEWRHNKIFSFVESVFKVKSNNFLGIGSGLGLSLSITNARSWNALGVEVSHTLVNYSREHLNLNVIEGFFSPAVQENIKLNNQSKFDFILIDNILEHISEPIKFIRDTLSLLSGDGVLLVIIPPVDWLRIFLTGFSRIRNHITSAQLNLFYDPEQHVSYFSRKAMRILTRNVGGCKLTSFRFHHSKLLNNWASSVMGFETGYYFIAKDSISTT